MGPLAAGLFTGAGTAVVSSLLGGIGSKWFADVSHAESEWASRESQRFAREMSNTAHQREVDDLRKAGLNPILSVAHSGASSPAPTTSGGHVPDLGAHAPRLASDAMSMVGVINNLRSTDASIRNMDAGTAASKAQALKTLAEMDNISHAGNLQKSMSRLNDELAKLRGAEAGSIKGGSVYHTIKSIMGLLKDFTNIAPTPSTAGGN